MKTTFKLTVLSALMILAAMPAIALDLPQARLQGLVGEKPDGYVAAVQNTPEVASLVAEVNQKRRAEYERISKENNQTVSVVAKLAAVQIVQGLPSGAKYLGDDGSWHTR